MHPEAALLVTRSQPIVPRAAMTRSNARVLALLPDIPQCKAKPHVVRIASRGSRKRLLRTPTRRQPLVS